MWGLPALREYYRPLRWTRPGTRLPSHRQAAETPIHLAVFGHLDLDDIEVQLAQQCGCLGKSMGYENRIIDQDAVGGVLLAFRHNHNVPATECLVSADFRPRKQ